MPITVLRGFGERSQQRGAATLVVVMLLFFVVSLTAAYTARNLIYEQRTSANLYRSTQSFEAAEAGLEWAISRINSGRVDSSCTPTNDDTFDTFRQRYLTINITNGDVQRIRRVGFSAASNLSYRWAACIFDGTDWACDCPRNDAAPIPPTAIAGPGPYPAFAVRFSNEAARPGLTRIEVNGCNSGDPGCLFNFGPGNALVCRSTLCSMIALQSAVVTPPLAAVTALGVITANDATVTVFNEDPVSGGWTLRSGTNINSAPGPLLHSVPGTPANASVLIDTALDSAILSGDPTDDCVLCMSTATFNLNPDTYRQQPAVLQIDCSVTCTGADVIAARAGHPERPIVLTGAGGLSLASAADSLGSIVAPYDPNNTPVLLRVDGPLSVTGDATVVGLLYARGAVLSAGTVRGAVISTGDLTLSGTATVIYDPVVLGALQRTQGSFVRVPGGWRDIP